MLYCHVTDYKGCDWSVQKYHHAVGATIVHREVNLEDCLDLCRRMDECVALDWLGGVLTCWMHLSQDNLDKTEPAIDSHLYVIQDRDNCGKFSHLVQVDIQEKWLNVICNIQWCQIF